VEDGAAGPEGADPTEALAAPATGAVAAAGVDAAAELDETGAAPRLEEAGAAGVVAALVEAVTAGVDEASDVACDC
jgi:hypothetical protein